MKASIFAAFVLAFSCAFQAQAATNFTEGVNYFLVQPPRVPNVPQGKVEVTEAFSYACPACNSFQPTMRKLKESMPANVVVNYLPASFNTAEDWPMFQLAFLTAQVLGIDQQTHDAMFDAVWKGGDLSILDASRNLKTRMPTIEDVAKFYSQKAGVPADKFVATSKSFAVDVKRRATEDLLQAYKIDRTPTIIVNGKYRLHVESAGDADKLVELVKFLVAKETK